MLVQPAMNLQSQPEGEAMYDNEQSLTERVQALARALTSSGLRLVAAESCTGGLFSGACTSVPGSSEWFHGAVVAYANAVKTDVLGVPGAVLEQHGAVSRETVQAMALGVCELLRAPVGLAISGIAGPGGGSVEKPVGTVCIGLAFKGVALSDVFHFVGERHEVRHQSVLTALDMLLDMLSTRLPDAVGDGED